VPTVFLRQSTCPSAEKQTPRLCVLWSWFDMQHPENQAQREMVVHASHFDQTLEALFRDLGAHHACFMARVHLTLYQKMNSMIKCTADSFARLGRFSRHICAQVNLQERCR